MHPLLPVGQVGPKLTPRWPQDGSNMVPRWLKMAPRWLKMAQDGPKYVYIYVCIDTYMSIETPKISKNVCVCVCVCVCVFFIVFANVGCRYFGGLDGPLGHILATLVPVLGPIWPPKVVQKWTKNCPKIVQKFVQK